MKIIVYGVGKIFKSNLYKINMDDVIGFVDSSLDSADKLFMDKEIIEPSLIKTYEFDYIVIFTDKYFNEIAERLIWNYGININKIINYLYIFEEESIFCKSRLAYAAAKFCNTYETKKVLDVSGFIGRTQYCCKKHFLLLDCFMINQYENETLFYYNIYNNIYYNVIDIKNIYYDFILILDMDIKSCIQYIHLLKEFGNYILFSIPHGKENEYAQIFGKNFHLLNIHGMLFGVICTCHKVKIYEVTHKSFIGLDDDLYVPIYAGSYKGGLDLYLHDNAGNHISEYNDKINEATAMYWIWKNDDSEYVGINHYRRFFQSKINSYGYFQKVELLTLLENYDIIVAKPEYFDNMSVEKYLKETVDFEAFETTMYVFKEILEDCEIKDKEAFDFVFKGNMIFPCNMMILKKTIYDEYCAWLFPKVFALLEKVDIKREWDNYSKRIIGFITERLFTVWIVQQKYSVYEMPIKFLGEFSVYGKN